MWTILPSDGLPIEVLVLPLYSLEDIGPKDIGDFTYKIRTLLGEVYDVVYPLATRLENPPLEPKKDDDDTWVLTEWERYQGALAHNQKRHELDEERTLNRSRELIRRCIKPEDRDRLITLADYDAIYEAVVPEEVAGGNIAQILRDFFPGEIRGQGNPRRVERVQITRTQRGDGLSGLSRLGDKIADRTENGNRGIFSDSSNRAGHNDMFTEARRVDVGITNREVESRTLTPALVGALIMYEYRQSRGRLTSGLKSALRLYAYQQQQTRRYAQIAVLNGVIQAGQQTMKEIMTAVESASSEQLPALLEQAKRLQKQMRLASRKLENVSKIQSY